MLTCNHLQTYYGAAHVLYDISLEVQPGTIACLLGRNGMGKTTCLRSVMGLTPPRSGNIVFQGQDITGRPPHHVARQGIGYVPEDRRIFPNLSVQDNLEIGRLRRRNGDKRWTIDRAYEAFPALRAVRHRTGGLLSGGEQQMLTIARTLMGNPALLLLDEPTEGLSPLIVRDLEELILRLKQEAGLTILLAAQDMRFAFKVADQIQLMERGRIVFRGSIEEARRQEEHLKARLAV